MVLCKGGAELNELQALAFSEHICCCGSWRDGTKRAPARAGQTAGQTAGRILHMLRSAVISTFRARPAHNFGEASRVFGLFPSPSSSHDTGLCYQFTLTHETGTTHAVIQTVLLFAKLSRTGGQIWAVLPLNSPHKPPNKPCRDFSNYIIKQGIFTVTFSVFTMMNFCNTLGIWQKIIMRVQKW